MATPKLKMKNAKKDALLCRQFFIAGKQHPRALLTGEAVVLVPATTVAVPGLGLWPSEHPFGRRGAPAFR